MAEDFEQETIRRESGGNPWVGWGVKDVRPYGFDETGFPRRPAVMGPAGPSTASGLYGITGTNWRRLAPKLGVTDFEPASQKKVRDALYAEAGESAWRPFWLAPQRGPTSTHNPDTGRTEPRIEFNAVVGKDPLDLILMAASQNQPAAKPKDDDALTLLNSFIEPPGASQERAAPLGAEIGGKPLPAPTAPPQPIATHIGGIESRTPRQDTIEPPGPGQIVPPGPPQQQRQAAPIAQPSPLDEIMRYAETGVHAMKPALTEIPKAVGEIGQAALGIGERAGLAEAQMEPWAAPEPQIPIRPGMERIGDAATFATGGLMSPLGVARPSAQTVASAMTRERGPSPLDSILDAARGVMADERGGEVLPFGPARQAKQAAEEEAKRAKVAEGIEAMRDRLRGDPPGAQVPQAVKDAMHRQGLFGFDSIREALAALREHPDWEPRWDMTDASAVRMGLNDIDKAKFFQDRSILRKYLSSPPGTFTDENFAGRSIWDIGPDTRGAVPLPPAIQKGLADAAKGIEKVFSPSSVDAASRKAEALFREEVGGARRSSAQAEAQISRRGTLANPRVGWTQALASEPWRPLVNRHIPAFERYIAEVQAGLNPPKPPLLHFLDFVETRGSGTAYQGPPELREFADILKKIYADRRMAIAAEPSTNWAGFIDDYFVHQWKDPNAARQAFAGGAGRQGSGRNLRQRDIPTISEGIDRGLVPASLDPVESTLSYVTNMDRYLAHNRIFRLGRDGGMIKFYGHGQQPDGWEQLTGRLAERAVATGGQPGALGLTAYAPEGFARIYNNAVSTGFMAGQLGGRFYTALLHAKNAITQSVLALSGYHASAMTQEATASAFANAIQGLKQGDIAAALKDLGLGSLQVGKALKSTFGTGKKMEQQYLGIEDHGPDFARAADLYAGAGGRVAGRGAEYRMTAGSNYFTAFRRGAMQLEWKAGLNKITEGNPIFAPARAAGFLGRELGRINETITAPLFDKMIPRLKAAAFFDEMNGWLKANPLATHEQQLARARRISDTIDDRFGEMVMDNIFWGQRSKQALMLAATSLGWEFGSIRSLGGGVADALRGGALETKGLGTPQDPYRVVREKMSPRTRYLIGLAGAIALENATYQFLKTGKTPGQDIGGLASPGGLVDLTVPRTGGQTPEGARERALLPGFEKDILGYAHDPLGEFAGKLAPGGRLALEAFTGRDYFGHEIAPFPKYTPPWFKAYADHVLKQMRPIPLAQDKLKGSNIGMAERFGGNRPAAERWQNPARSNRMEIMRDITSLRGQLRGLWAHGARTTEERSGLVEKQKEIVRQIDELARQLGARPAPSRIYQPGASP